MKDETTILITAGPTREYIDPVRYISNDSSGKMGYAFAKAAKKLGMKVTLITGPTNLKPPVNVGLINITSAEELMRMTQREAPKNDIIIMAAAVADWKPKVCKKHKIKRNNMSSSDLRAHRSLGVVGTRGSSICVSAKGGSASGGKHENDESLNSPNIKFLPTPDILKTICKTKRNDQIIIGFALETKNLLKSAVIKLKEKKCDWIIANSADAIGSKVNCGYLIHRSEKTIKIQKTTKEKFAKSILKYIL